MRSFAFQLACVALVVACVVVTATPPPSAKPDPPPVHAHRNSVAKSPSSKVVKPSNEADQEVATLSQNELNSMWQQYKTSHNKQYSTIL